MPFDYADEEEKFDFTDEGGLYVSDIHESDVDASDDLKDVEDYVAEYDK